MSFFEFQQRNAREKNQTPATVVVGMSGGVDSSTSALLLKQAGYNVIGVYLHFWYEASITERRSVSEERCCSIDGQADARRVARMLGIPFYTLNFSEIFRREVVDYFVDAYKDGRTPNPCIKCNKKIKFGLFLQKAQEIFGADYIATGHYAQIRTSADGARVELHKGADEAKDQSYFLYNLTQEKLRHVLFPIGHLRKPQVREIAEKNGLIVARKAESQGLCFLKEGRHYGFLQRNLKDQLKSGAIMDQNGRTVGTHLGLPLYTLGQRQGINIGGTGPYYVTRMDYATNTLHVSRDRGDARLYKKYLTLDEISSTSDVGAAEVFAQPQRVEVRVRHGHKEAAATAVMQDGRLTVEFDEAQRAVMRGQSAVLYQGSRVLGGGVILQTAGEDAPAIESAQQIAYTTPVTS